MTPDDAPSLPPLPVPRPLHLLEQPLQIADQEWKSTARPILCSGTDIHAGIMVCPERIQTGWWTDLPCHRDYYQVLTSREATLDLSRSEYSKVVLHVFFFMTRVSSWKQKHLRRRKSRTKVKGNRVNEPVRRYGVVARIAPQHRHLDPDGCPAIEALFQSRKEEQDIDFFAVSPIIPMRQVLPFIGPSPPPISIPNSFSSYLEPPHHHPRRRNQNRIQHGQGNAGSDRVLDSHRSQSAFSARRCF